MSEAHSLRSFVDRLQGVCIESDIDVETIILRNGGKEDAIAFAKDIQRQYQVLNVRVIHHARPKPGYGALVRYGLAHATGRYCLLVSSDGHAIEMLPTYLSQARKGAHLVECSACKQQMDGADMPWRLKCFQALYRRLMRVLLAVDISPTCSFKLVDRIYLMAIGIQSNGLAVVPEMTLKMYLSGGKVASINGTQLSSKPDNVKFPVMREGFAYMYVLLRAWWHRLGFSWF